MISLCRPPWGLLLFLLPLFHLLDFFSLCCVCDILFRVAVSEQQFRMMNYGLKEKAGLFWNHYSVPSAGTKEFQNGSFSIICVEAEGERREGRESKPGRMGRQEGRKETEE